MSAYFCLLIQFLAGVIRISNKASEFLPLELPIFAIRAYKFKIAIFYFSTDAFYH